MSISEEQNQQQVNQQRVQNEQQQTAGEFQKGLATRLAAQHASQEKQQARQMAQQRDESGNVVIVLSDPTRKLLIDALNASAYEHTPSAQNISMTIRRLCGELNNGELSAPAGFPNSTVAKKAIQYVLGSLASLAGGDIISDGQSYYDQYRQFDFVLTKGLQHLRTPPQACANAIVEIENQAPMAGVSLSGRRQL